MKKSIVFLFIVNLFANTQFISIANYNVQNLFDLKDNGTEYKEFIPNRLFWNKRAFNTKLRNISYVIKKLNCDIIALEEIENKNALNHLLKYLPKYKYKKFIKDSRSAIGLAVISKYKIIDYKKIDVDINDPRIRPILKVTIKIKKFSLDIFINHWASKRAKESRRVLSAYTLFEYLKQYQNNEYIIIGDLNENYNEFQTIKFEKRLNDTYGITAINDVLFSTKTINYKTILCDIKDVKKGVCLHYNPWLDLNIYDRFSYKFRGNNTPDNILLPQNMFDNHGIDYINNSFYVYKPNFLYHNNKIIKWQTNKLLGYSDHLPIVAKFKIMTSLSIDNTKKIESTSINQLYKIEHISNAIHLKNIIVIYKYKNHAIIKQQNSKAIYLYNCASKLREGFIYDLDVNLISDYKGLKEIKKISNIIKKSYKVDYKNLYLDARKKSIRKLLFNPKYQNEVVKNLKGVYKNHKIYFDKKFIKIYFANKSIKIPNNKVIIIKKGHLSTYKGKIQIILYKKNDFLIFLK